MMLRCKSSNTMHNNRRNDASDTITGGGMAGDFHDCAGAGDGGNVDGSMMLLAQVWRRQQQQARTVHSKGGSSSPQQEHAVSSSSSSMKGACLPAPRCNAMRRLRVGCFARCSTRPRGEQLAGGVLGQRLVAAVAKASWILSELAATTE